LFGALSGHFKELSLDPFASHSVKHLITQSLQYADSSDTLAFTERLASLISELTPDAGALAQDAAGSNVGRTIVAEVSKSL
jgi:hypothetical protein